MAAKAKDLVDISVDGLTFSMTPDVHVLLKAGQLDPDVADDPSAPRRQSPPRTAFLSFRSFVDGKPVTKFDGTSFVDAAVLTGRYVNGLPPEYDVRVPLR